MLSRTDAEPTGCLSKGAAADPVTSRPAGAARIMLIRHAEKPSKTGAPPYGVDPQGNPDPESLSPRGWQRAGALTVLFAPSRGSVEPALSTPQHLFACGNEKERKRLRPLQTIIPLAERLELPVDTSFVKGEERELADCALRLPGVVLISWEHNNIHQIANRILGDSTTAPQRWPEDRFDLVWVFDLSAGSYRFSQIPQLLLSGDLDRVI